MDIFRRADVEVIDAQTGATAETAETSSVLTIAALETAAGIYGRAFGSASLEPATYGGDMLHDIARDLIRGGESVWDIQTGLRAVQWEIAGGIDASTWTYRLNFNTPNGDAQLTRRADDVFHFTYAITEGSWEGHGPLQIASDTGGMASWLEKRMGEEMSASVGRAIPAPLDSMAANDLTKLKEDIGQLKGRSALVPSMRTGFGSGQGSSVASDWRSMRIGAEPPSSLIELRRQVTRDVLAACGIPPALVDSQGASTREAWRHFLFASLIPLGNRVTRELTRKTSIDTKIDWTDLQASDVVGRARALRSMVDSGVELEQALALSGLLIDD